MISSVLSNSQIRTFKRCRRKYWLAYVRKLKPLRYAKTGARQLGTRVHGALERYYLPPDSVEPLAAALTFLDELRQLELSELDQETGGDIAADIEKEHAFAVTMIEGYDQWVQEEGVDIDIEVVDAEVALNVPSPLEGVNLIGKLDLIVRSISTGAEGFVDHKTVGSLQSPLKTLGMDEQFRMYALMRRIGTTAQPDAPPAFQIYNMLLKSKRTDRAKPPFYARYEVYINETELRGMWHRLYGELTEISRFEDAITADPAHHRSIAYPTPTGDCSWDCDFFGVCPMFDDDRADPEHVLSINFQVGDPHEHYEGKLNG